MLQPEDAGGESAPEAAQPMQRPNAEHIVDLESFLGESEAAYEDQPGNAACGKSSDRVHHVRTRTDGNKSSQGAVVHETRIVAASNQGRDDAADPSP